MASGLAIDMTKDNVVLFNRLQQKMSFSCFFRVVTITNKAKGGYVNIYVKAT